MNYYKVVKVDGDKLVSAIADNLYKTTYKVDEWTYSNFQNPALSLFVTTNVAYTLDTLLSRWSFYNDSIVDVYSLNVYEVYKCEIRLSKIKTFPKEDFSFEAEPQESTDSSWIPPYTELAEAVKLTHRLTSAELAKLIAAKYR